MTLPREVREEIEQHPEKTYMTESGREAREKERQWREFEAQFKRMISDRYMMAEYEEQRKKRDRRILIRAGMLVAIVVVVSIVLS